MNKFFYPRLAAVTLKKHAKSYIPYILSCAGTIIMYYIMSMLANNTSLVNISGAETLESIFNFGTWVITIFAVVFIFYTHSFLIKNRKKEFGLFNILGMEKRHISLIVFFETLYSSAISLVVGIGGGILLSKVIILTLKKLLGFDVELNFEIPPAAVSSTLILFFVILMLMTLLNTWRQIHLTNPADLLKGGKVGEKEPKTKWIMAVFGVACIAVGYYIAITTDDPFAALFLFFVAAVLVIIGTYFLFIAGSIALLKILKKSKKYYYKSKHFTSVSSMMYRMKQNAVGLGSICILSTMVLIMVAGTVSLYLGTEDALRTRYPRDMAVTVKNINEDNITAIDEAIAGVTNEYQADEISQITYCYLTFSAYQDNGEFSDGLLGYSASISIIYVISLEDYNRMENQNTTLEANEVLIFEPGIAFEGNNIVFGDLKYNIKSKLDSLSIDGAESAMIRDSYYVIVPDIAAMNDIYSETMSEETLAEQGALSPINYYYAFDVDKSIDQTELREAIEVSLTDHGLSFYAESLDENRENFHAFYSGFLFLGILLGILFVMATVLIIYYKQISEGYDDKERFDIMQKVGMGQREVKKSIQSQVVTVFFLPLITAGIHVLASFKMITKLLAVLNLNNITLFAICTIGTFLVFSIMYIVVYSLTAREYYKIVRR